MQEMKQKRLLFVIIILIVFIIVQSRKINSLKQYSLLLLNSIDEASANNISLMYALDEANANIERVNSNIEDAQYYAWEGYKEMGEALDSLETVETIDY